MIAKVKSPKTFWEGSVGLEKLKCDKIKRFFSLSLSLVSCSQRSWASRTWRTSGGDDPMSPQTTSVPSSRPRLSRHQTGYRCDRLSASEVWALFWTGSPPGTRWATRRLKPTHCHDSKAILCQYHKRLKLSSSPWTNQMLLLCFLCLQPPDTSTCPLPAPLSPTHQPHLCLTPTDAPINPTDWFSWLLVVLQGALRHHGFDTWSILLSLSVSAELTSDLCHEPSLSLWTLLHHSL